MQNEIKFNSFLRRVRGLKIYLFICWKILSSLVIGTIKKWFLLIWPPENTFLYLNYPKSIFLLLHQWKISIISQKCVTLTIRAFCQNLQKFSFSCQDRLSPSSFPEKEKKKHQALPFRYCYRYLHKQIMRDFQFKDISANVQEK